MNNPLPASASSIAIEAISFLAGSPEHLEQFILQSGVDGADIRQLATTPEFQAGILAYFAADEALLMTFCGNCGIHPNEVTKAALTASGGPVAGPGEFVS